MLFRKCYNTEVMFRRNDRSSQVIQDNARIPEFAFLSEDDLYFDSACQSLRPKSVVAAMRKYYEEYNSCGERVRYKWGARVDAEVTETREKVLRFLGFSRKDFFTSFTLNTTYGINLILTQLDNQKAHFAKIITSDIEHNSPFLATMEFAKKWQIPREIISRNRDGSIDLAKADFTDSLVVMNAVSNIDARKLENLREVVKKIHSQGGIFVIDAAQVLGFYSGWFREQLAKIGADAVCFSSHKMYGPSLGVIVVRKNLVQKFTTNFIGGGMVDDVQAEKYILSGLSNPDEHLHTLLEPGLQLYAEIIGFGAALDFLVSRKKSDYDQIEQISRKIFDFLKSREKSGVHVINSEPTSTISFYSDKIDSHLLADALSQSGVMTRSGYFCCHYYLDHVKNYPPLVRLSFSFANNLNDADKLVGILSHAL